MSQYPKAKEASAWVADQCVKNGYPAVKAPEMAESFLLDRLLRPAGKRTRLNVMVQITEDRRLELSWVYRVPFIIKARLIDGEGNARRCFIELSKETARALFEETCRYIEKLERQEKESLWSEQLTRLHARKKEC